MRNVLAACTIHMLANSAFSGLGETPSSADSVTWPTLSPQRRSPASAAASEHLSGRITLQPSTANAAGTANRT